MKEVQIWKGITVLFASTAENGFRRPNASTKEELH